MISEIYTLSPLFNFPRILIFHHLTLLFTGPRMCLGDSMARLEVFLIFSNLIRQFKFIKHGDSGLEVAHVKESHPISSAEHFQVVIEER